MLVSLFAVFGKVGPSFSMLLQRQNFENQMAGKDFLECHSEAAGHFHKKPNPCMKFVRIR